MLNAALDKGNYRAALALVSTAGRRPDLYAEKILSQRYRFLWIGVPKAASRSLIAALHALDPKAVLYHGLSLDELLLVHPEARDYFRFAFLRHPCARLLSFYADKHVRGRNDREAYRWFIEPWRGLRPGMGFDELCRWLCTPCGSDAFADRHWLSQSRQVISADGRLPQYLGRYETLEAGWRTVCERLDMPAAPLPRLNAGRYDAMPGGRIDIDADICGPASALCGLPPGWRGGAAGMAAVMPDGRIDTTPTSAACCVGAMLRTTTWVATGRRRRDGRSDAGRAHRHRRRHLRPAASALC